ncbi:MAG: thiol peroxidase [Anaerolineales bacterium]|nr:thiol peroxidase [Anaerolineales bacterium]
MERTGLLKLGDKDATIVGPDIEVGQAAPEFTVHDHDWNQVNALESTPGKVRIIASLPSLATGVCDAETRRFNEEAAGLGDDVVIYGISTDLPYSLKSWCAAAGVDKVKVVSDAYDANFGEKYGVLIKDRRILRRAVFVVDKDGKVTYADYMPALGDAPDFDAVLAAARAAL